MTMKTKILITVGALLCVAAASVVRNQLELPEAKVTVRVIDEAGQAISGVNVLLVFKDRLKYNDIPMSGQTDGNGLFSGQGGCDAAIGSSLKKDGFYYGDAAIPHFNDDKDGRWLPWNPTISTVLRKIENPVSMYARKVSVEIPAAEEPCGFDLMESDWVAPYGRGKTADFIVTLTRRYSSWYDFDVNATIAFSDRLDGLQEVALPKEFASSRFKWPRLASEDGYHRSFAARYAWFPKNINKEPIRTFKADERGQAYFFRVRTVEDNGRIVSALYGKIDGGIILEPREAKLCKIIFLYYLNPTPLDRNMEFDPTKNLFPNLKDEERPRDP